VRTLVVDHPLVAHKLTALRDERTDSPTFRRLADELGDAAGVRGDRDVRVEPVEVDRPVASATGWPAEPAGAARRPVLRAGLGMLDGMTRLLPTPRSASSAWSATSRSLVRRRTRTGCRTTSRAARCSSSDPMLATGGTLVATFELLKDRGAAQDHRHLPAGPRPRASPRSTAAFADDSGCRDVVTPAVDERLTDKGYITPGLGDAGDRLYGVV
jgi:uracil phosphoribosyltransferase